MDKLLNPVLRLPLKYKISIIITFILSIVILLLASILFDKERNILIQEMEKRGHLILKNLTQAGWEAIINDNKTVTSDVFNEILKDKSVMYAIILNKHKKIFDKAGILEESNTLFTDIDFSKSYVVERRYNGTEIIEMGKPILLITRNKKVLLGYAIVGISKESVIKAINKAKRNVFYLAVIFIIAGIVISFIFASTITAPINKIVKVMEKVGKGDLNQRVIISAKDEIGILADSFNKMIKHLKEKLLMSKYISKNTIEMISHNDVNAVELGGQRKEVTLLFSDIRGFTSYSESHSPEEVINMLNKYLSFQAEIINKNNGAVDKFVGDEVVGVFQGKNMVLDAVKCAIAIQKKIKEENIKSNDNIHIGIGINTGEVVMGNMGSKNRMDYTVIGDNVNLAARLCSAAEGGEILITDSVYQRIKNKIKVKNPRNIKVKGKSAPVKVYAVDY